MGEQEQQGDLAVEERQLQEGLLLEGEQQQGGLALEGQEQQGGLALEGQEQQGDLALEEQQLQEGLLMEGEQQQEGLEPGHNSQLVSNILGFAKTRGQDFWPARRLGGMGASLVRIQFFGTAVVAVVSGDSWVGYSEEVEQRVSKAVSSSSFALAMQELMAAKARVERDGEDELDFVAKLHAAKPKQPAVRRQLGKLNRVDLQHSGRLTNAAMRDYMVESEQGVPTFKCRDCPKFETLKPVVAKRHARNHDQPKKPPKKPATMKKHFCSKPGCDESFVLVSQLDKHYQKEHQVVNGGYKCWGCSTPSKQVVLKNWKQYVAHLRRTKTHNSSAGQELECEFCDYTTSSDRGFNLAVHIKRHHGPHTLAKELILEILDTMFEAEREEVVDDVEEIELEQESEHEVGRGRVESNNRQRPKSNLDQQIEALENSPQLCEYEMVKLHNLRQQKQMLFDLQLGGGEQDGEREEEEVQPRRKRKRPSFQSVGGRKSSRLQVSAEIDNVEKVDTDEDELNLEDANFEERQNDKSDSERDPLEGPSSAEGIKKRFLCGLCDYSCKRERRLREHMDDVHSNRATKISCTRCVKAVFETWYDMIQHRSKCILRCEYPDCSWTTKEARRVAPHRRAHLAKMRRME